MPGHSESTGNTQPPVQRPNLSQDASAHSPESDPASPASQAAVNDKYTARLWEVHQKLSGEKRLVAPHQGLTPPPNEDELRQNPSRQKEMAVSAAYTPSKWLLEQELSPRGSWSQESDEDVYDAAAREELSGLCFSGGGIRSATFCLGVLQALAGAKKLGNFDYLSTVSGGGYIHQWLASWIARDPDRIQSVQQKLAPIPETGSPASWPDPIVWLRRYSSYLTPQRGLFSADTWTMIAVWFRNTFLNQIVLFSFLACCLLLMRALTYPFVSTLSGKAFERGYLELPLPFGIWGALFLVLGCGAFSFIPLWRALHSVTKPAVDNQPPSGALGDGGVLGWIVAPSCLLAILASLEAMGRVSVPYGRPFPLLLGCLIAFVLGILFAMIFGGEAPKLFRTLAPRCSTGVFVAFMIVSAIACTAVAFAAPIYLAHFAGGANCVRGTAAQVTAFVDRAFSTPPASDPRAPQRLLAVFFPVLFLFMLFVAVRLHLGMIGRFYSESRREWLARLGGWSAMVALAWMALSAIALFSPPVLQWFCQPATLHWAWGGLSVLAIHAVTLYAGGSGNSDGKPKQGTLLGYSLFDVVGIVGAPVCILSLLIIVSGLIDLALHWSAGLTPQWSGGLQWTGGSLHPLIYAASFAALVLLIFLLFGWRIDVNFFSMHSFYRDRLARCYLGATNPNRMPDPFTHFDDRESGSHKDLLVSELLPQRFGGKGDGNSKPYDGPFPIFCTTVNLTFGEDLGLQDRKGASFAFTPLLSGYHVGWTAEKGSGDDAAFNGFVPTVDYAYGNGGISVSTVAAISGAAVNPNMGYNSSAPLAFLMTLFNVRLGWWLANPRKPKVWPSLYNVPTPIFGIRYLLSELLGLADDTSKYVCLSDGGHFENMGLYELVRRRCTHIVICDAEGDTNTVFEGIGNAIAICRTDFGAEIDLKLSQLIPDSETGYSPEHFVVGTIRYPAPPGAGKKGEEKKYEGTIVYIKTSLTGDETGDILHHKRACPEFPQDTTLNQWFTESQFESYRRLGQHIGEKASGKIRVRP